MADSFYEPLGGDLFRASEHTVGPWDPGAQHGGPPAALLCRQMEQCAPRPGWLLARTTVEILGPIPVADLVAPARVVRPGRSVEMLEAEIQAGDRVVARARAWRIRRDQDGASTDGLAVPPPRRPDEVPDDVAVPPLPDTATQTNWPGGYIPAMEWRFAAGRFGEPGPATVWVRPRVPLLPDEDMSPVERVLLVADSGNGVSNELDPTAWYFINPELTVHLHREPVGDWLCLDARTTVDPAGVGLAATRLFDTEGMVGRGAQALLVSRR